MSRDADAPQDLNELALDELGESDLDDHDDRSGHEDRSRRSHRDGTAPRSAPEQRSPRERRARRGRRPTPPLPSQVQVHTPTAAQAGHETGEALTNEARAIINSRRSSTSLRTTLGVLSLTALIVATVFGVRTLGTGQSATALPSGHPDVSAMSAEEREAMVAGSSDAGQPEPADPQAVARLEARIAQNPQDIGSMRSLADLHYAVNDYANAAQWQERILTVDPGNEDALMMLGLAAFNSGDMPRARSAWSTSLEVDPENTAALYNLGFAHLAEGRYDEARASWEKVEELAAGSSLATDARSSITRLDELVAGQDG